MAALSWPLIVLPEVSGVLSFASFGASAALIFGAPGAPFSQPRSVLLGHALSGGAGAAAGALTIAAGLPAAASAPLAVAAALWAMMAKQALHPPAAGTAILSAVTPLNIEELAAVLITQSALLIISGTGFSRLAGAAPYPNKI